MKESIRKYIQKGIKSRKLKSILVGFGFTLAIAIFGIIITIIQYLLECIWMPLGVIWILFLIGIALSITFYYTTIEKNE